MIDFGEPNNVTMLSTYYNSTNQGRRSLNLNLDNFLTIILIIGENQPNFIFFREKKLVTSRYFTLGEGGGENNIILN